MFGNKIIGVFFTQFFCYIMSYYVFFPSYLFFGVGCKATSLQTVLIPDGEQTLDILRHNTAL